VFNLQGSELIIILLLALVVLGPEKLPDAMRKAGQFYAELKKMSTGFQSEFRAAVEEPLRELKETANTIRDSADFTKLQSGERAEKPKSAEMVAPADMDAVPSNDLPFKPDPHDEVGTEPALAELPAEVAPGDQEPFASVVITNRATERVPEPSADSTDQTDQTDPPSTEQPSTEQPQAPVPFSGTQVSGDGAAPSTSTSIDRPSEGDVSGTVESSGERDEGSQDGSSNEGGREPLE
jgi:sec-independent protein translocase protein TatB